MKWDVRIEVPDSVGKEQLQGEITETLVAGFDLQPEECAVEVKEAA